MNGVMVDESLMRSKNKRGCL